VITENILSRESVGIDASLSMYPSTVWGGTFDVGYSNVLPDRTNTYYVYVLKGRVAISVPRDAEARQEVHLLGENSYLSAPGPLFFSVKDEPASLFVIERIGYRGQLVAGHREAVGRLSYIDGCSDSMLVYPARQGDPVLNHLHFPHGIVQTQHLHPSIRIGCVVAGRGSAYGPDWEKPLNLGDVFLLGEQEIHSFRTDKSGESMDVIAYHPDSDWGPVDASHPMLNRTYIKHGQPR
jgi:hypothetical protein